MYAFPVRRFTHTKLRVIALWKPPNWVDTVVMYFSFFFPFAFFFVCSKNDSCSGQLEVRLI